ncbi:MAG: hypothetical protein ACJ741_21680 [Pyrinomonadaceae bacterium]
MAKKDTTNGKQKIVRVFPVDKSSAGPETSLKGNGSFGGGISNLAHSLPGTSAAQKR